MVSTQQFIPIERVREGAIILKNGAIRGILMVSSLNFALKSDDEQTAILLQFQNFLNSLDFSLEIIVQSRRLNITGYLDKLKELEKKQENELLKTQTGEYGKFIEELIKAGSIMAKIFYVVVPFTSLDLRQAAGGVRGLPKLPPRIAKLTEEEFQQYKSQLWQRMEFVAMGLRRCGLGAVPLDAPEIIELLWSVHHPEEAEEGYYPEIPPELLL